MMKVSRYFLLFCFMLMIVAGFNGKDDEKVDDKECSSEENSNFLSEADFIGPKPDDRHFDPKSMIPVDFSSWKERNSDVYAWIRIPDTKIDYPILQGGPYDGYYLDHTIDGEAGYPGSIYTEKVNARDFTDFNTVIYGHNMKNGTMFKHLHKFKEEEFFDSHQFFEIYTEEETKIYRVYAALVYSDRHIMYGFDYETTEGRQAYLDSLDTGESWNQFREGMVVDENSKIVTLATCIGGRPDNRWIVIGVEME